MLISEEKTEDILGKKKELDENIKKLRKEYNDLLYYISHEFKAPLRAIVHLTQWIEEELEDNISKQAKKNLDLLRNRVNKLESMTEGMLHYARAGMIGFEITSVSINEIIDEILDLINPPSDFKFRIDKDLPVIDTYHTKIWQVFWNLIENSIKHHHLADGEIRIKFKDKGDHFEFTVADNGPGIPREKLDKIFILFQSGSSDYNIGTGLPVTKKIIDHTGGKLKILSTSESGTVISFTWKKIMNE